MFSWRGGLSLFKSFAAWSIHLSFMACDKSWSFHILYEKCKISSCTTGIRKSDTAMDPIDLLGSLSIMAWITPTNLGVLFLSEWGFWVAIPSWSPLDSSNSLNPLHGPQIDTQTLKFLYWCFLHEYMPFPNFWRSELWHGVVFLTEGVQLTLVCCTID